MFDSYIALNATQADWNDWHWQIKHSIDSFERLGEIAKLT
jgi:L-lysine 2,3-aminomutase